MFRTALLFSILSIWIAGPKSSQVYSDDRPNIIFLLSDDQTVGAAGCYGNADIITPQLDRLAGQGVRFLNHYNTTSICMASRASIMTGLYEYRHGCNFSHGPMRREIFNHSYPVLLRQFGYYTGFAGKIGFVIEGEKFEAFETEFDQWAGGPGQTHYETKKNKGISQYADRYPHCSRAYGAWAQDFIKSAKQSGKPFCLSISFKAPHLPADADPIDVNLYREKTQFQRPANYGVENGSHLSAQAKTSRAAKDYRNWITDYDSTVKDYYARITGVDAAVGMIREELDRQGLENNTVIIFTSDNGYNSGSHGLGDKVVPYEEGSKSPLIIFDPRSDAGNKGRTCSAVTANVDMPATIMDFAGIPVHDDIDGKSLRSLIYDPNGRVREWLPLFNFWGIPSAQSMAVVSERWKYIYWYYGDKLTPTEELFNLAEDRGEMHNAFADAHASIDLRTARDAYNAELSFMKSKVMRGHGYEPYAELFDPAITWSRKVPLLAQTKGAGGEDGDSEPLPSEPSKRKGSERNKSSNAPKSQSE